MLYPLTKKKKKSFSHFHPPSSLIFIHSQSSPNTEWCAPWIVTRFILADNSGDLYVYLWLDESCFALPWCTFMVGWVLNTKDQLINQLNTWQTPPRASKTFALSLLCPKSRQAMMMFPIITFLQQCAAEFHWVQSMEKPSNRCLSPCVILYKMASIKALFWQLWSLHW